ncbi:hypothetical protein [Azonexus sp.]|uniref:hypothetical protein n=1 Tax=Azonexus sp. TaxID=1872668 RepID=UPI0039E234D3
MNISLLSSYATLLERQPALFSAVEHLTIPGSQEKAMADIIRACENVLALPASRADALKNAPDIARLPQIARGVCMGYDFHLAPEGPQLIEINTNAGGALLNACLLAGRGRAEAAQKLQDEIFSMFVAEWRAARGAAPLRSIAIVDEHPDAQFLLPEFELFRDLFTAHGITAVIADPGELRWCDETLYCGAQPIDLVYNRLTDFYLESPPCAALRSAYLAGKILLTPHPQVHATHADKRRLLTLCDADRLSAWGVCKAEQSILLAGIPRTFAVRLEDQEALWAERKHLFFKPAAGFGSRAAYRGDKLTKRVFAEILDGDYIAQSFAPPSEHPVCVLGQWHNLKADFRCYVYVGQVLHIAARLYQGQTTNFRTPGGGFAPVFVEEEKT